MTCFGREVDLLFDNLVVITSILIFSQFRTGFENGIRLLMRIRGRCQKMKFVCQIGFSIKSANESGGRNPDGVPGHPLAGHGSANN